jgi:hypothetical protein
VLISHIEYNRQTTDTKRMSPMASHSPLLLLLVVVASLLTDSHVHSFGIGRLYQHNNQASSQHQEPESLKSVTMTDAAATTHDIQFGPRIEIIHNTKEYLDFIAQDDRLCVVK